MSNAAPIKPAYAILIFAIGVLLATTLSTLLTWASLEAEFYGFQRYASDERLGGITCPKMMTLAETASVSLEVDNTTSNEISPVVRIDTSRSGISDTIQDQFILQPGKSQKLTQTISARNIDLDYFIFAKAYRYPAYPLPRAEATCGVVVLPQVPFLNGTQIFTLWLGLSLLLAPLGSWLWNASTRLALNTNGKNAAKTLTVVSMLGLFVSLQGLWLIGVLTLALTVLLFISILRYAVSD